MTPRFQLIAIAASLATSVSSTHAQSGSIVLTSDSSIITTGSTPESSIPSVVGAGEAVYDPAQQTVTFPNAGSTPPLPPTDDGAIGTTTPPSGGLITPGVLPGLDAPLDPGLPPSEALVLTCSGDVSASTNTPASFINCLGDLVVSNGTLVAETSISLLAAGSLTLDRVNLTAPKLTLQAGSTFTVTGGTILSGETIDIVSQSVNTVGEPNALGQGAINLGGGSVIVANTGAIPEPGTWALMGLGLVGIALARRRR